MISNDELINWINKMPLWLRKATEIYYQKNEITDGDIKYLADLCFKEDINYQIHGLNLINHDEKNNFVLKSIDSVVGVNAISSTKPLEFGNKGITVVYGLNGSGKSGYIRILKMISGAKYREEIKNNIYDGKTVSPKANITIANSDGNKTYLCDLKKPGQYKELRDIDIFDTKISNAYVNEAKEATYEPWIFSLLEELANTAERLKNELRMQKNKYQIQEYVFPENLKNLDQYKKLEAITYKTRIEDFPNKWQNEDNRKLEDLRSKNQIGHLQSEIKRLENEQRTIQSLQNYFNPMKKYFDRNQEYVDSKGEWDRAYAEKKAAELLFAENASKIDAESVSLESWKKLWEYARSFSEECTRLRTQSVFALRGGKCPLCLQKVDSDKYYERIVTIDSYVNGKITEEEQKKKKDFELKITFKGHLKSKEDLKLLIESSGLTDSKELIININDAVAEYRDFIENNKDEYDGRYVDVAPVIDILNNKFNSNEEAIHSLKKLIESEEQKTIIDQINELEAQKALVDNYFIIKTNIDFLKEIHELELAEKKVSTNKITSKSKELAQELITTEYVNRFEQELKKISKNDIEVKLVQQKAGKGKTPYKVVLFDVSGNQISPQDILSEGENRATALAAFFAESSGRIENTPLVVDDPISSLDYLYENKVIDRLVQAAMIRQVIVFTHRISMVVGIYEKAKEYKVEYKEISLKSSKSKKGVPSDFSDIGTKSTSQLNTLIDHKLPKLKRLDEFSEDYLVLFHNICQDFRNVVEKSIEEILLNEVVKRFRREIQTKNKLEKLANITTEDCQMFDRFMTKYSYYDHSMSDETPLIEMSIDELEKDLKELQTWISKRK